MRLALIPLFLIPLTIACAGGKDGAPGADGEDGAPGSNGQNGASGADGEDGAPGADGEDGAPGAEGDDGTPGADGADGAPGAEGDDGTPGADGEDALCADIETLTFIDDGVSWSADATYDTPTTFTAHLNDTGMEVSLAFYGLESFTYSGGIEFTASLTEASSFIVMATDSCTVDIHTVNITLADPDPDPDPDPGSTTFDYTGSEQVFTVPDGVTSINIEAFGASGGDTIDGILGGLGGYVQATIDVTPGQVLEIYVGELGPTKSDDSTTTVGGYNGGGSVNQTSGSAGGGTGGGATDIRGYPYGLADRLVVAGGGGGAGWTDRLAEGGAGGGLVGGDGYSTTPVEYPPGEGGTQAEGGLGAYFSSEYPNEDGTLGNGGACWHDGAECGAGGGGWYGGGGGAFVGGGGGSSFTVAGATAVVHSQGVHLGDGELYISW